MKEELKAVLLIIYEFNKCPLHIAIQYVLT